MSQPASVPIATRSETEAPLRVVLVDDEPLAREELAYLLGAAGGVEVVASGANGLQAVQLIREHRPDALFLDVQMPGLDGFGVLKQLREERMPLPEVVFATAFDQYAVRAFEVNAIDYLLKPFDSARLENTLNKLRSRTGASPAAASSPERSDTTAKLDALLKLVEESAQARESAAAAPASRPHRGKIVLRAGSRLLLVDQKDICFAGIEDGAITVVTPTLEGQSNCRTLEELMDQLDPETFFRAHRSFVVNLGHIREVVPWFKSTYQLRMDDAKKTEVPVSRTQTRRLRELFNL